MQRQKLSRGLLVSTRLEALDEVVPGWNTWRPPRRARVTLDHVIFRCHVNHIHVEELAGRTEMTAFTAM